MNRIAWKKFLRPCLIASLSLLLFFSGYTYSFLDIFIKAWQDRNVVDVLWLAERDSLVVDSFRPRAVEATEATIDSTINTTITRHQKSGKNTVCTSETICYTFYINSDSDVEYQKSTDGGASWSGTSTQIHAGTWLALTIWYDRWTPGDTTGNLVHMVYFSTADDLTYAVFDTSNDSVTSNVVIASTGAQGATTATNDVTVSKGTDGDLYAGTVDATAPTSPANFIHKCSATCTTASNWVSAGANPWDNNGDDTDGDHALVLLPLSNTAAHDSGDMMLVSYDVADGTVEYKVYDDSADSWSSNFTNIDNATDNATYQHALGGTVDPTTGYLYITFVHLPGTSNTSEVRAWKYNDGWSQLTDPWPDTTDGGSILIDANIGVNSNNSDLYAVYIRADSSATANDVYYAVSTNDGSSWSSDNLLSSGTDRDHRQVSINASSDKRLFAVWHGPPTTGTSLFGNTVANVTPITVGTSGSQTANLDIPSSNQYIGGAFTMVRASGTANVTQIVVKDTGSVNANTNLSNVDIYYETAATCTYDGGETSFGTAASFDGSEEATITGTAAVGTSQVCFYVVLDVGSGASASQTAEIEISNPSTKVTVSDGAVTPRTAVTISGTTTFQAGASPTLTFTISDNSVGFGTLSAADDFFANGAGTGSATEVEAHTIVASTNATNGYTITVNGTTLTYAGATISAIGASNTASSPGSEQFGLRATASGGDGAVSAPYAASGFALDTAAFPDELAVDSNGDDVSTTYSLRYLANIGSNTDAGVYNATLIYVIVANF